MKITLEGQNYELDAHQALADGTLKLVGIIPLKAGDVYTDPKLKSCNLLLVQAGYDRSWCDKVTESGGLWQLLGIRLSCNSDTFFHKPHTLSEIKEYLNGKGMTLLKNINDKVGDLVG